MEQNIYGYPSHEEVQYNEDQLYNQYPGHIRDYHFAYPEGSTPMSELGMDSNWNSASPASASSPAESTQGLEPAQNWPGAVTPGIVDENTSGMDGPYNMPFHNYAPMFNNEFNNDFAVEPCVSYPHVANTHVDPNLIQPDAFMAPQAAPQAFNVSRQPRGYSHSQSPPYRQDSSSAFLAPASQQPIAPDMERRMSTNSFESGYSAASDDKLDNKHLCDICDKKYKDLKAHQTSHLPERPEKCPVESCEWNEKGFSRKYDRERHTLTHFKGEFVCTFCPPSELKSFNRADVFKRHLKNVHNADANKRNTRKNRSRSAGLASTNFVTGSKGNCLTCKKDFGEAQGFYEHLEDCVLESIQRTSSSGIQNAKNLAEVENDQDVLATLEKNNVPYGELDADGEDEDMDEEAALTRDFRPGSLAASKHSASRIKTTSNPKNGVQKSKGMTHSRGGFSQSMPNGHKGRKIKAEYPNAWGIDPAQMTIRKRTAATFDGSHRLNKDEMMLSTKHEVRIPLGDATGASVTDLDVQTMMRTEAYHNMNPADKDTWISDDPTPADSQAMHAMQQQAGFDEAAAQATMAGTGFFAPKEFDEAAAQAPVAGTGFFAPTNFM